MFRSIASIRGCVTNSIHSQHSAFNTTVLAFMFHVLSLLAVCTIVSFFMFYLRLSHQSINQSLFISGKQSPF